VLGMLVGRLAGDRIPVIDGIEVTPAEDQLKNFGATAASSGAVALFHMVGVTPEAPDINTALQGGTPQQIVDVDLPALRAARADLTTAHGQPLDMVVLGSPHFSIAEFQQLAPLLKNRHVHPRVQFLVTTSRVMVDRARETGALQTLLAFGGRVTVDTCILATPMLPNTIKTLMTNSGKYAYYAPGLLNAQTVFGSLADCVESAVKGALVQDESLWEA